MASTRGDSDTQKMSVTRKYRDTCVFNMVYAGHHQDTTLLFDRVALVKALHDYQTATTTPDDLAAYEAVSNTIHDPTHHADLFR